MDNYFARSPCQKHAKQRNEVRMLVTHSPSSLRFRSIFSSDKAQSGNELERGRKLGRWGREKNERGKKKRVAGSSTRQELMEFVFQCLQLQIANQVRKDTHLCTQALAGTGQHKYCRRSQGALGISIHYLRSFLCLHRKCIHLQFRCTPNQSYYLPINIQQRWWEKEELGNQKCATSRPHTEQFMRSFLSNWQFMMIFHH